MYQVNRPTCVTVIGWVWTLIGGLTFLSSIMTISLFSVIQYTTDSDVDIFGDNSYSPWLLVLTTAAYASGSLLAFIAGIYFLKLRMWARHVLEMMTWIAMAFVVLSMAGSVHESILMASKPEMDGFFGVSVAIVVAINLIYVFGLIVMLRYLRGDKVKNALTAAS